MNELLKITKFENATNIFLFFSFFSFPSFLPFSFFCDDCICTTLQLQVPLHPL